MRALICDKHGQACGLAAPAAFKALIEMMVSADLARQGTGVCNETFYLSPHRRNEFTSLPGVKSLAALLRHEATMYLGQISFSVPVPAVPGLRCQHPLRITAAPGNR